MKQTWKQIGSLFLSVCMVVTMLPVTAFAETGTKDSGEITAFAALDEDISAQTVELGTAENKLNLPKKLTATVTKTVTTTTGSAVTATVSGDDTATGSEAQKQEQQEETKEITEETTVEVSGWTSAPDYNGDIEGNYVFTPMLALPDDLTLAEGVTLPTVTVTVEEPTAPMARGLTAPLGVGESIAINETNFPDANFRAWLLNSENLDGKGADGTLTTAEIAMIDYLSVKSQSIKSLAGLEHFTALKTLNCNINPLKSLPELPSGLTTLYCNENALTSLPALPSSLTTLSCAMNNLTELPELPSSLTELNCGDNRLTGVTLNGSATYIKINVSNNKMTDTSAVTGPSIDWLSADSVSGDANFVFYPQKTSTTAKPLATPGGLAWDSTIPGKAKWNAVDNASKYRIQLYKDGAEQGLAYLIDKTVTEYDYTSQVAIVGAGKYTFKVQAIGDVTNWSDGAQSMASAEYNYTPVTGTVPIIISENSTVFTVGTVSNFMVTADNSPTSFAVSGTLPTGISFDTATGILSGTPAVGTAGSYNLSITATNGDGTSTAQSFALTVVNPAAGPVFFDTATSTFNLENLPTAGDESGGSGATAWTWDSTDKKLMLSGAGPYTLAGTANGNMRVGATASNTDLTLNGAKFTNSSNSSALYFQSGGTLKVTADSEITGNINAPMRELFNIILNGADLQISSTLGLPALWADDLTISGSGKVMAISSQTGVFCVGDLTVENGATLFSSGVTGIQFQGARTIKGAGTIKADGSKFGISENGIGKALTFDFSGDLDISGGEHGIHMFVDDASDTTKVTFARQPANLSIRGNNGIIGVSLPTLSAGGTVRLENTANIPGLTEVYNASGTEFPSNAPVALSILDTPVTDANKNNITGPGISGIVSYDPATKTLTLNNAVISPSSGSVYGILSQDDLTVNLVGQNRIGAAPNNPTSEADYNVGIGIQSNKSLSITGEGSLTIYDGVTGLYGWDTLTVDIGGRLIVTEYGDERRSCCLKTDGELIIKRGSLDLTSHNSKGLKGNSIVIEGGIISAQTGGGEHFAFSTAPSFGGGYAHRVFAGDSAASAVEVPSPTAATFTASKYVRIQPAGAETYTITLDANGGSVSPTTLQTDADEKLSSLPTPTRSGSYRFDGWFTAASGGTKVITSTVLSSNTTIYAHWSDTSGGGNGGGSGSGGGSSSGGSSGSTTAPATTTPGKAPNQPVTAAAPVTATAGQNGTANASIPEKSVTEAITKAQTDAKAQGKTANGTTVALNVTMPKGATSLTATLTKQSLDSLVSAGVTNLELNGSPVTVSFDTKALAEIQKQSSGNISITIAPNASLSSSAKAMIGTRPVYDLTVGYQKDGKNATVSSFGGGTATVSVPYTPAKGEAIGGLYAVYVDAKGNATRIAGSTYDANSKSVIFTTTHFSLYGIGYTAPSAKFTDVSSHWAKESIDYVVGRGLLSGTAETTFAPDTAMTRGMLVTALGRLANVDTKAYITNSFTDVKADSAFRPYIEWAYKKGIVQGTGNGKFEPDRAITREEIAVIFTNFAKATGYTLPVTRNATTYADASSIGSTYKTAVTAMQQAGIMMGGTSNKFNPKSSATRAEVSSMLHRYIKLTIDPATAQGWAKNDAGQYLYYKDSKALTGTQTINGVKYFLGTDGTLKTGWVKDDAGNWRFYSGNTMLVGFWDLGANGNNKTYYFTKDGIMVAGKWLEIDGKWYYFNADGSLAKSTKIDEYEVDANGVRKG